MLDTQILRAPFRLTDSEAPGWAKWFVFNKPAVAHSGSRTPALDYVINNWASKKTEEFQSRSSEDSDSGIYISLHGEQIKNEFENKKRIY